MPVSYLDISPSLGIRQDAFGNPVGKALTEWLPPARLPDIRLEGRTCAVVPYAPVYLLGLFTALSHDDGRMWSYLPWGPFSTPEDLGESIETYQKDRDFQTFLILKDEVAVGYASYMRYDLANGSVEIGGVTFSPALQRSTLATEAMYLMMKHAFAHGYRRYEWKCDQLNIPSNRAALRLGFQFEGVFRNAVVSKERRRDTAWYSVITEDWPQVCARQEAWLDPDNFHADGTQKQGLSSLAAK